MIRIVSDSAADITQEEAAQMNVDIVPLVITFGEKEFQQKTQADFDEFYHQLKKAKELPITGRPSPENYLQIYAEAEKKGEEVIVLCLSSGLSGTYESAYLAKELSAYSDHVTVIDTEQAIMTQRMLVEYAVRLRDQGADVQTIIAKVNDVKKRMWVGGVIDTLKYLQMGGRIPKSMAVIGGILNIKPVIVLKEKTLQEVAKKRGLAGGKKSLWSEFEKVPIDESFPVYFGYTLDKAKGEVFMEETAAKYQLQDPRLVPIGGVIGTHVGPEGIAIAFVRKYSP